MRPKVVEWPQVVRDLAEQYAYIARDNPRAAERYLTAARKTIERLAGSPTMGSHWETPDPELQGLRWWPVSRYKNYLIFYREIAAGIEVVRILHAARDIEAVLTSTSRR